MSNKGLLTIIAVVLLGIFTVLIIQLNDQSPLEQFGNDLGDSIENVGDGINDTIS